MKIKSILVSGLVIGSIAMVGCQSTESTEESKVEYNYNTSAPVEEYHEEESEVQDQETESDEVKFNCVWCGKEHTESESYYNEDGMSACSKECFDNFMNEQLEDIEETTQDPTIQSFEEDPVESTMKSENMPEEMAHDCPNCGTTVHMYSHTEFRQSGRTLHVYFCENCGNRYDFSCN